jgi:hypothetical protein
MGLLISQASNNIIPPALLDLRIRKQERLVFDTKK